MNTTIDEMSLVELMEMEKELKERRAATREQLGKYATEKKFSPCVKCGMQVGVREGARHRKLGCPRRSKKKAA